jgi:hypothetical protein
MTRMQQLGVVTAVLLAAALSSSAADERYRDATPVITQYFDLISSGNYDIAGDMWTPEAIERSSRFGIKYTGIPIKADCNSPVIRMPDQAKANLTTSIRKYEELDSAIWYRLEYADVYGSTLMKYNYYLQRRGDWLWLGFPQDFYAASWPVTESRYLRVHMHPEARKYVNPAALAEADKFVEQAGRRLGMSDSTLQQIALSKIEYFLCPSDSVVEQLTGFRVVGTLDLASNDVVSADFPHFHELTHLLINIRLGELPLYTLPVMREGLATSLAGRWGKGAAPLMDLAVFLYQDSLIVLDSIFTMQGFDSESGADMVYPVAGMFTAFLEEKIGMAGLLDLYLGLSGPFDEVNGLSAAAVHDKIVAAAKVADWSALKAEYDTYVTRHRNEREMALAGAGERRKKIVSDGRAAVYDDGDWLAFEFSMAPGDSLCQGNLVFGPADALKGQASLLFENQYGVDRKFDGYRFGVRFDQNEAGLYDYASNLLLAKYICGISPSEGYFDANQKKVAFRFRKTALNGILPEKGRFILLPM